MRARPLPADTPDHRRLTARTPACARPPATSLVIATVTARAKLMMPWCLVMVCLTAACADDRATANSQANARAIAAAGNPSPASFRLQVDSINAHLEHRWQADGVTPADVCDDRTFARRVYLDLAGRIPSVAELRAFEADGRADKHDALIELLLHSEDSVQHFTDVFDALLMGRGTPDKYEQRRSSDWRAWLERVFRDNRRWDEVTREILLARPREKRDRGLVWFLYERDNKPQDIAEAVAPAFFGIRIECAQCHDHMIADEIEQAHYWGLVAFFNRSANAKSKWGPSVRESAIGGFSEFASLDGSSYPNHLTFFGADTVAEARPAAGVKQTDEDAFYESAMLPDGNRVPQFSRRQQFVDQIVDGHPLIARAFVNRVWAMMLGRGIVHPFDEMDSVHEPSHPELLDWLAAEFRRDYDIRRIVRLIVSCKAYRLQARRPDGVDDPATFAWYLERPLTAEQYVRSVQQAVAGEFRNDHQLLVSVRDRLVDVLPDENVTTVKDALFLTNNAALNGFLDDSIDGGLLADISQQSSIDEQIDLVFLQVFGRSADPQERQQLEQFLTASPARAQHRWKLALWAMLTSAEFRFNH